MDTFIHRDFDNPSPDDVLSLVSFGTWCSLILTGQSGQEAYTYFRRYPKDGYDLKALIGALSLINALHASFMIHVKYSIRLPRRSHAWGSATTLVLEATACIIILISHFFFARRVYKLGLRTLPFVLFVVRMFPPQELHARLLTIKPPVLALAVFTCFFTVYVYVRHILRARYTHH
ncbi:hypothetical protein V8D89_003033 [Ganoderma adspersum]